MSGPKSSYYDVTEELKRLLREQRLEEERRRIEEEKRRRAEEERKRREEKARQARIKKSDDAIDKAFASEPFPKKKDRKIYQKNEKLKVE